MMPWKLDEKIDHYDDRPYRRVEIAVDEAVAA
jgi:hypothetical protein